MRAILSVAGFSLLLCIGLAAPMNSARMQQRSEPPTADTKLGESVKVTLITSSDKYELKKGDKIPVIIRISNISDTRLKLRNRPAFRIKRVGVRKNEFRSGDIYNGVIKTPKSYDPEGLFVEKAGHLDFEADIAELELMSGFSSIEYLKNIFEELPIGEFYFEAEVVLEVSAGVFQRSASNKITITNRISHVD